MTPDTSSPLDERLVLHGLHAPRAARVLARLLTLLGAVSGRDVKIAMPGGSVEHWNEEAGEVWMERLATKFPKSVWLNPVQQNLWNYTQSIRQIGGLMGGRMFPLTLDGLDGAMKVLAR